MFNQSRLLCARFLNSLNKTRRQKGSSPQSRRRAFLEALEPRMVLTAPAPPPSVEYLNPTAEINPLG
jgi:hypothetical protein